MTGYIGDPGHLTAVGEVIVFAESPGHAAKKARKKIVAPDGGQLWFNAVRLEDE